MSHVLVDTDVVSYLFKNDTRAQHYRRYLVGNILVISFMTLAELHRWTLVRQWSEARRNRLMEHARKFALYPFDAALCRAWAEVTYASARAGRPIGTADAWIAATAILHGIPLITHNPSHYAGIRELTLLSAAPMR